MSYYYDMLPQYFGVYSWYLIIPGILLILITKTSNNAIRYALIACFASIFIFFSFIVKTKMQAYFFPACLIGIIFIAFAITDLCRRFNIHSHGMYMFSFFYCIYLFNYEATTSYWHSPYDPNRIGKAKNTELYKHLKEHIPPNVKCVLNVSPFASPEVMFFNDDLTVYDSQQDPATLQWLANKKIPVAVFKDHGSSKMPDFIRNYSGATFIDIDLGDQ